VRLGTCIAIELAVATGGLAGAWCGVGWAIDRASTYALDREAAAEPAAPMPVPAAAMQAVAVPAPTLRVTLAAAPAAAAAPAGAAEPGATVFGAADADLLAPIAATPLARVKINRGGSSLSLRLEFANGARAAFKPTQTHPQSDPRRELAAYRIDRLLGIGHVAPAKAGAFKVADIIAAADLSIRAELARRIDAEGIVSGDVLRGAMSWWIPVIKDGSIAGHPLDDPDGMATWARYLQADADTPAMPVELRPLLAQISTCVVFDLVVDNADRWSGTNTKTSPDGATLYFMDNTLSFSPHTLGHNANLTPFHRISVFPRKLIGRLREISLADVTAAIDGDGKDEGLAPLLNPWEVRAILARRDHVIHTIDQLIARYGEDAVLALP
jgi:hypothetical protein